MALMVEKTIVTFITFPQGPKKQFTFMNMPINLPLITCNQATKVL